jgi:hypothetical protein
MRNVLPVILAMALFGCSGANDPTQQAEIERLKAETEKLRAEAAKTNQDNLERQAEWESNRKLREANARMNERAASGDLQGALAGENNLNKQ